MDGTLVYDKDVVSGVISDFKNVDTGLSAVESSLSSAINQLINSTGFHLLGSSINAASATNSVAACSNAINSLLNNTRRMQATILMYNGDENALGNFFLSLDEDEIVSLPNDIKCAYSDFIKKSFDFVFKRCGASVLTFGISVLEGVAEFAETGLDLVNLAATGLNTMYTAGFDIVNKLFGRDTSFTKDMWERTKAQVSTKHVENWFNSFYENNVIGQGLKKNAFLFDTVRTVGSGLGYAAGVSSLAIFTGGLSSGALGSVSVTELGTVAGVMGVSGNTEEAWSNGAGIGQGLMRGVAGGAWEGLQWAIGAKIGADGGFGDKLANKIFKGNISNLKTSATKVALTSMDSAVEGFVQPALDLMYKDSYIDDYGKEVVFATDASLGEKYSKLFEEAGGMGSVITQGVMGGLGSALGEINGSSKLISVDEKNSLDYSDVIDGIDNTIDNMARKIFSSDINDNRINNIKSENINNVRPFVSLDDLDASKVTNTRAKTGLALATIKLFDNTSAFRNMSRNVFKISCDAFDKVSDAFTNASGKHTAFELKDLLVDAVYNQSSGIELGSSEPAAVAVDMASNRDTIISKKANFPKDLNSYKAIKNNNI